MDLAHGTRSELERGYGVVERIASFIAPVLVNAQGVHHGHVAHEVACQVQQMNGPGFEKVDDVVITKVEFSAEERRVDDRPIGNEAFGAPVRRAIALVGNAHQRHAAQVGQPAQAIAIGQG